MPRNTIITTYENADQRGLLDQPFKDGRQDNSGQVMTERKALHERKKAFVAVTREELDRGREKGEDVKSEELKDAADIKVEDRARMETMPEEKEEHKGTTSPLGEGDDTKQRLLKRERVDEDEEEATTSPELEEISSSILSAVKSRAPRKKVKRAGDIYYLRPDGW